MKIINTDDAVGHILCHDLTQIIPGEVKHTVFRKGHIVREEDIPVLKSIGKEHLYVWEKTEGMLHENEAAEILYDLCKNDYMKPSEIKEGKIDIIAEIDGLLKIDRERLYAVNKMGDMMIATQHSNTPIKKGEKIAGTRVIPLVIEEERMNKAKEVAVGAPILTLLPYIKKTAVVVTTGSEVFKGRIEDKFGPVVKSKLEEYGVKVLYQTIVDDKQEDIVAAIKKGIEDGAEMVFCTGGMSVDPDDKTPGAIKATGAEIISYGAPVLPGAMFLISYYNGEIPVCGLPGCVMYDKRTVFDLVLPRLLAGEKLTFEDVAAYGEGGLCTHCPVCIFPHCSFGK